MTKSAPAQDLVLTDATAASLADVEALARGALSPMALAYVTSGAGDERTLGWNVEAFGRIRLRPRVLTDVSRLDTSAELLGLRLPIPLLLAPTAYHRLVHPEGELATARGAAAAGIPWIVSTCTTTTLGAIQEAAPTGTRWLQLYITSDRDRARDLLQEAEATGIGAVCLTVDTPVLGTRNQEQRVGFRLPADCVSPYLNHIEATFVSLTWRDVDWLRGTTRIPILLKGILAAEDATRAADEGVAGIIVSNHGARNLDTVPATIDALPEIADAVAGRLPILLDGGIRRGTDIVKAVALGATAVLIGRPYLYGLAVAGAAGVEHVIRTLRVELEAALKLMGRPSIGAIDRSALWDHASGR